MLNHFVIQGLKLKYQYCGAAYTLAKETNVTSRIYLCLFALPPTPPHSPGALTRTFVSGTQQEGSTLKRQHTHCNWLCGHHNVVFEGSKMFLLKPTRLMLMSYRLYGYYIVVLAGWENCSPIVSRWAHQLSCITLQE